MRKKRCKQCGKSFEFNYRWKQDRVKKFCSHHCYGENKKGKKPWNKGTHMWKTRKHPWLGKKRSEEDCQRMSLAMIGKPGRHTGHKHSEATKKHWSKIRKGIHNSPATEFKKGEHMGENHPQWKGGRILDSYGYIIIKTTTHPHRAKNDYIREHRLVVEKMISRYLRRKEHIHHINKNKIDNSPKNLMAFKSNSAHRRFHDNPNNVKPEEIIFDGRKLS